MKKILTKVAITILISINVVVLLACTGAGHGSYYNNNDNSPSYGNGLSHGMRSFNEGMNSLINSNNRIERRKREREIHTLRMQSLRQQIELQKIKNAEIEFHNDRYKRWAAVLVAKGIPYQAENGDFWNWDNDNDGRVEPIYVRGYYKTNGTYVRAHYRARPE